MAKETEPEETELDDPTQDGADGEEPDYKALYEKALKSPPPQQVGEPLEGEPQGAQRAQVHRAQGRPDRRGAPGRAGERERRPQGERRALRARGLRGQGDRPRPRDRGDAQRVGRGRADRAGRRPRGGHVTIHAPARGATCCAGRRWWRAGCFNPRAREGRDGTAQARAPAPGRFNPRARKGRDPAGGYAASRARRFQPTRPRGARPKRSKG